MEIAAGDLLRSYSQSALATMARVNGVVTQGTSKAALIKALTGRLYEQARVEKALADLAPSEREALDRMILAGGELPSQVLRSLLERDQIITRSRRSPYSYAEPEKGSATSRGSTNFADITARLGALGLVFSAQSYNGNLLELTVPGYTLLIPDAIMPYLPAVSLELVTTEPPATVIEANASALLRDLYTLLSEAERQPLPLTMRGLLMKRALVKLDQELLVSQVTAQTRSEDELGRITFLRALGEDLGLLSAGVGALAANPGIERFLERPAGERQQELYRLYRNTARWNELFRIPGLKPYSKTSSIRSAPPAVTFARQRVLAELAELPAERWIPLAHLLDRLRLRAYELLLPRRIDYDRYRYYYGYQHVNPYYLGQELIGMRLDGVDDPEGWDRIEAGLIRAMLREPLSSLGVVDLGLQHDDLIAFRVSKTGARLLRGEPLLSVEAAPRVVVQPNFQIFAFEPTGEDVLYTLDRLADRVRAEQAIEYELTRESIYRALQTGLEPDEIIGFLEQVSTVGLPQNVRRTLEEWGDQHQRITIRRGVGLLHAVDEATLDALYADAELAPLLGRRVAPTAALVSIDNLRQLPGRLLASGRLPALSEGDDLLPRPAFAVDAEGRIVFRHRLPSIALLRELRPFASGDDATDGVFRLTRESLRAGARAGLDAEEIVQTLERFNGGPLPEEATAMVKRWAKDWGKGALIDAVLLQTERAEILNDLLADPALRSSLQRIPGAPSLALVRPERVEQVRQALAERDMELKGELLR